MLINSKEILELKMPISQISEVTQLTEEKIEKLKEKNKNRISDENLLKIIRDFKSAENFDNKIMKMLIERIEVYEDKTVNIIFNF